VVIDTDGIDTEHIKINKNVCMNFLIISPNSPQLSIGGVERYIKNLIEYCERQEGRYYFILPSKTKDAIIKQKNVTIYYRESLDMAPRPGKGLDIGLASKKTVKSKSHEFFSFLNTFIEQKEIDAVIAQNFHVGLPPSYSLLVNMICHAKDVPLFLQLHSFSTNELQTELINNLFWQKIICVSKSVAGDVFQKGSNIKSLTTKYLGVNIKEFNQVVNKKWLKKKLKLSQEKKVILCASRILHGYKDIIQEKGFINLLDAFSKIAHQDESLRLLLAIGKPPARLHIQFQEALKKLEGFIQIHGVEDQVIVRTFKLEEMPRVYAGSDVFVLASENETFGQVYLEAMACGLPVLGTKVGGVPEIIEDGVNGYLTIPNDASHLSNRLLSLLNDKDVRQLFIANGLKTIDRQFNSEKTFKTLFSFIEKTLLKI